MAALVPVEGDPFAESDATPADAPAASGKLIPVDHDPFANDNNAPAAPEADLESRRAAAQQQYEAAMKASNQQKPWYQNLAEGIPRGAERGTLGILQAFNAVNPQDAADVAKQTRVAGEGTGIAGGIGETIADPRMAALLGTGPLGWGARAAAGAGIGWTDPTETNSPMKEGLHSAARDAAAFTLLPPAITGIAGVASKPIGAIQKGLANLTGLDAAKLASFKAAGIDPTLGDVSDSPVVQRAQDVLKNVPFAAKTIVGGENAVKSGITQGLTDTAGYDDKLERVVGGDALKQGLNTYVDRGKDMFKTAYSNFDNKYKLAADLTPATNTMDKITEIEGRANTPEALNQYLSPAEQKTMAAFKDAAAHNNVSGQPSITYNDLKLFRTSIGQKLSDYTIGSSEKSALRELYGSMTQDMRQTVSDKGGVPAVQAFDRLNSQYGKFQTNLDNNINNIINKPEVTQMLTAVRQGTALPDKTSAIMRALPQDQRDIVRGSLIKEMGTARTQAGSGEFDPVRFAGAFGKLDPAAQDALMTGMGNDTRTKFKAILESAQNAKETTLQGNPSGTAKNIGLMSAAGLMYSHPVIATALLSTGNVTARMMTNPKFIDWMAKAPDQLITNPSRTIGMLSAVAASDSRASDDVKNYQQDLQQKYQPPVPLKTPSPAPGDQSANQVPPSFQMAEGSRPGVYKDTTGHRTVGNGFNMDNPSARDIWKTAGVNSDFDAVRSGKAQIAPEEAQKLLSTSYGIAQKDIKSLVPNIDNLQPHEQEALTHLAYQYGKPRLQQALPGVLAMANQGNPKGAAARLMASDYAKAFPPRARALANMLFNNAPYKEG